MENNNALITKLNKEIDYYLEKGDYDRADEACKKLCRIQGLIPADRMPEDFPGQLKRKEHETMHIKKTSKRISGIVAAAAAAVLLVGGTVSAAVMYNNNIHFSTKGFTVGKDENFTATFAPEDGEATELFMPEMTEEDIITPVSEETGTDATAWLSKKIRDETYAVWDSDDAVNWTKGYQTTRVTEYKYADYFAAADDAGFDRLFGTNYSGNVSYHENEHLPDESDIAAGTGSTTDYSISGDFSYGNGQFSLIQDKYQADAAGEVSEAVSMVITTTGETGNEREYVNAAGITFQLSDDTELGDTRTTTMFTGDTCEAILQFTGMTENEIHEVLDSIWP